MLKIALVLFAGLISFEASARSNMSTDKQTVFDNATCGTLAEYKARGELDERGMDVHMLRSEVLPFMPDINGATNIYYVLVKTEITYDYLVQKGPDMGYSCYRCPNLKLVVSKEQMSVACKNEQL